jgi:hypothetical protein
MQDIMLNTKNLSVMAESVNDIILTNEYSDQNQNQTNKLKAIGVILGIYREAFI